MDADFSSFHVVPRKAIFVHEFTVPTTVFQIMGDLPEFERAVRNVIRDTKFDADVEVSVFEANIRVLG